MKNFFSLIGFCAALSASADIVIDNVSVRQLWPWSTDIKVTYTISGAMTPVNISMTPYNGDEKLKEAIDFLPYLSGDIYAQTNGTHSITIAAQAAFGAARSAFDKFAVELTATPDTDVLYKIYTIADGTCEDVTRGGLLSGRYGTYETDFAAVGRAFGVEGFNTSLEDVMIWTGVTNNIDYRTKKIVFRKIPAKGKSFTMGRCGEHNLADNENNQIPHQVSFANDFYMAVFEYTIGQAFELRDTAVGKVNITISPYFTNETYWLGRPLNCARPQTRRKLQYWPGCSHEEPDQDLYGFVGQMRQKTDGVLFDLPTEAMWEFACRAGTTTDWNCGLDNYGNDATKIQTAISRCQYNSNCNYSQVGSIDKNSDADTGTAIVGTYAPNAWGLYDMHGNVSELCLDLYQKDNSSFVGDDPVGPEAASYPTTANRVRRGGGFYLSQNYNGAAYRMGSATDVTSVYLGARLCIIIRD